LNVSFGDAELDKSDDGTSIQDELAKMTGQKTVPNIFINGKHVGGCDDVHKLHSQGQLLSKINNQTSQ
jgi:glutaredoxin